MNKNDLTWLKEKLETSLREVCIDALKEAQTLPEIMHGMMVMSVAGDCCKNMKNHYSELKMLIEDIGQDIGLTEQEFISLVDDITTRVLDEFIERPNREPDDIYDDYWY